MENIHKVAILVLVVIFLLATSLYISLTNPDLQFLFFFTGMLIAAACMIYFWSGYVGLNRFAMSRQQSKAKSLELWREHRKNMGEPEFEMLPGERTLIPLAPLYFPSYELTGGCLGVVVTNMRILIGFPAFPGKHGAVFATTESFGKRNNLWHKDAPEIPESIGKADFMYSPLFTGLLRKISDYDSRIESIESGNDELGDFVSVSFTGGYGSMDFYTPDAKKIVDIFSTPIVR